MNAFGGCGWVDVGRWARVQVVSRACFVTVGSNASVITSTGGAFRKSAGVGISSARGVFRVGIGSGAGGPMGPTVGVLFSSVMIGAPGLAERGAEEAARRRRVASVLVLQTISELPRSERYRGVAAMCTPVYISGGESQYKN